jgi:RNA polymerase sigma-70 factor, ECF subfamily
VTELEFGNIVGETKKTVLAAVQKHLPARFYHSIDDVVQETYMRAFRHLSSGKFRNEAAVSSWLYTIARNESLRMARKLGREEEKMEKLQEEAMVNGVNDVPHYLHDMTMLENMLDQIPLKYREVMLLRSRGVSEEEVAQQLGIRKGTVKSRFSRGREMLQRVAGEVQ